MKAAINTSYRNNFPRKKNNYGTKIKQNVFYQPADSRKAGNGIRRQACLECGDIVLAIVPIDKTFILLLLDYNTSFFTGYYSWYYFEIRYYNNTGEGELHCMYYGPLNVFHIINDLFVLPTTHNSVKLGKVFKAYEYLWRD